MRLILFDLDDTLSDHLGTSRAALGEVAATHSALAAREFAPLARRHAALLDEIHPRVLSGELSPERGRAVRFAGLLAWAGAAADEADGDALARVYRAAYLRHRRALPGAHAVLLALRQRHPSAIIAILSNNLRAEQEDALRQLEFTGLVDWLMVPSDVGGRGKPDPALFHAALVRAAVAPGQAAMVGDSWVNDVQGARAAGLRAVWLDRHGAGLPASGDPGIARLESFVAVDAAVGVIMGPGRG